jgi:LysM repeat protein
MSRRGWILNALLCVFVAPLPRLAEGQGVTDTQQTTDKQPAADAAQPTGATQPAADAAQPAKGKRAKGPRPKISYGGVDYYLPAPRDQIPIPANLPAPYTVVKGDTLWGISKRFLADPFLWPLLWEVNVATVPNPHRIYPGQQLVFPTGTMVPSGPGETVSGINNPLAGKAFHGERGEQQPEYIRGGYAFEDMFDPHAPRRSAPDSTMATAGFISPSDYEGPRIVEAELPHPDIGEHDVVYLGIGSSNGVTAGQVYEVIRQRRPVYRPGTFIQVGVLMVQVGRIQVVCVQDDTAIALVTKAYTSLERGDFIIPYRVHEAPMTTGSPDTDACQPARGEIRGRILETKKGGRNTSDAVIVTEGDVVYLDVGQRDNVTAGQYFVVFRRSRLGTKYPMLQVGEAVVLAVEQETATAMVTAMRQDISVGDYVQLK